MNPENIARELSNVYTRTKKRGAARLHIVTSPHQIASIHGGWRTEWISDSGCLMQLGPGGSVRGERANFTRLVLGCIEAKFCK